MPQCPLVCNWVATCRFVARALAWPSWMALAVHPRRNSAILVGIVALLYLTDWPRQAHWLNADERNWITSTLSEEKESKQKVQSYTIWQALRQRDVIFLTMCYFFAATGNYGIGFWLPSFLKRLSGESDAKVTLLAALPYIAGFLVQQFNGWHLIELVNAVGTRRFLFR